MRTIEELTKAIERNPKDVVAYNNRGGRYDYKKRIRSCHSRLHQSHRVRPGICLCI